ncbi:GntR family transcriptional regulator [Promicromonospora iranensis]|uniref:DNA-binding GntR family transcriptional regulator n=1 Tax=Promicromonospora iranensis TaxID=1105144 RepID=A0ABU2CUK7_9MICO|nr:GntR family transcriptional regulator [Promicromonospora iranensis]MDR7385004.1 DNA-binding GntR family transcriptional regulator [Promicromonospora iranensis]
MTMPSAEAALGPASGFEPESARVARVVREQIVDGTREPGSKLVERDLAAELGVSRIPVRDALRALVGEGLVTPRPRSWAVVREFTDADVAHLQEVREATDPLHFRLAAERRTPEQLAAMTEAWEREAAAATEGDGPRARRAAADFHEAVVSAAGNPVLAELHAVTASRVRWLLAQHDDLAGIADEHRALLDAVRDGDPQTAARLARAHLRTSRAAAAERR